MKPQGCTSKVQLLRHGNKVPQMSKFYISIHISNIIMRTNKILDVSHGLRLTFLFIGALIVTEATFQPTIS